MFRFGPISAAVTQPPFFCSEKYELDKLLTVGDTKAIRETMSNVKKPVKGQALYFDPWDDPLKSVIADRKRLEKQKEDYFEARRYQDSLKTIPKIQYHPTSELNKMKSLSTMSGSQLTADNYSNYDGVDDLEGQQKKAFRAARKGDTNVLYDYFMKSETNVPEDLLSKHSNSLAYVTLMNKTKLSNRQHRSTASQSNIDSRSKFGSINTRDENDDVDDNDDDRNMNLFNDTGMDFEMEYDPNQSIQDFDFPFHSDEDRGAENSYGMGYENNDMEYGNGIAASAPMSPAAPKSPAAIANTPADAGADEDLDDSIRLHSADFAREYGGFQNYEEDGHDGYQYDSNWQAVDLEFEGGDTDQQEIDDPVDGGIEDRIGKLMGYEDP